VARLETLTEEKKEAVFAWDPNVDRLGEMPIDVIEALADRLLVGPPRSEAEES
jgi:hypothetical protein